MDAPLGIPTLKNRTALWLVTAILTGGIIMGLELVAFRLYAPYFGYSIYVWGSMISVVMVALSAGYVFGGWVADRSRTDVALYSIILLSGAYQLVILFVYRTILRGLWQSGEFAGTTLATLLIFVVPMTTLAATLTLCDTPARPVRSYRIDCRKSLRALNCGQHCRRSRHQLLSGASLGDTRNASDPLWHIGSDWSFRTRGPAANGGDRSTAFGLFAICSAMEIARGDCLEDRVSL